jgi:trehalose-phosphatase
LECLKERARQIAKSTPAIWVEDKGMVLTIHYARASACDVSRVRQEMTRAILPLNGLFHGIAGERGFELMPAEMGDKGTAVRHELAIAGKAALPVFVGDDAVDEPAFASLMGGITIRVGRPCRTRARFRLSSVQEVRTFLELLNKEIE